MDGTFNLKYPTISVPYKNMQNEYVRNLNNFVNKIQYNKNDHMHAKYP